jgi:hypothetical protein
MAKGRLLFMPECVRTPRGRTQKPRPTAASKESTVSGLVYIPRYVSDPIEAYLLARIEAEPWRADALRRTQHYGWGLRR